MIMGKRDKRKFHKYKVVFEKLHGILLVEEPTAVLAICNGGLVNGLSQERIYEVFEPYGDIFDTILLPNESFAIVRFDSVKSSTAAMNSPISIDWPGGERAYLSFVGVMPEMPAANRKFNMPPGLILIEDFITEDEEKKLLACVQMNESSSLKHRSVKHYGHEFCYSSNRASSSVEPIPEDFSYLWPRLLEMRGISFAPDQCTVNKYCPGDGIPPHVDTHSAFSEYIISLSLQSCVCMEWKKEGVGDIHHVLLPRRSLCVMSEEARYGWTHGIASRKNDVVPSKHAGLTVQPRQERTSLTFRCRREGECSCIYPTLCDTVRDRLKNKPGQISEENAAEFEKACVHGVYEEIADHFSETRHKPWPNVVQFLRSFPKGSLILDVGCGNGKYLNCYDDAALVGCDRSENLLSVCNSRGFPVFVCDCLEIPIRDCAMDGCISIAVIHHLSTKERRLKAMQELVRVIRPGGRALIYVWAKNQEADRAKSSYLKQRKKNKQLPEQTSQSVLTAGNVALPVHTNRTNFQHSDMFVPWKKKSNPGDESGPLFLRYYHVFEESELMTMASSLLDVECEKYYYDQGNWCIVLKKR